MKKSTGKKEIKLSHNVKLVYNEHEQMDGDPKGWFLIVDNESAIRPILNAIAPIKGAKVAIPDYVVHLDDKKLFEIYEAVTCRMRS